MKYAACHPDRRHAGRGLCLRCYSKARYHGTLLPRKLEKCIPKCHPDRPIFAHGLCSKCYYRLKRARYRKEAPEKHRAWAQKYYSKNLIRIMLRNAEKRAFESGVPFSITEADIAIPERCPILGIPLGLLPPGKRSGPTDNSPSVDRLIPELGYVPGNVAVISRKANTLKNDGTAEEHEKIAAWIRQQELPRK
jgi:hypothetical protein